jgi:translocation and assembly module TamA
MFNPKAALFLLLVPALAQSSEPVLNINGLNEEQTSNVSGFLSLSQEPCDAPKWRIRKLFEKSDKEIGKALRALGYYTPTIRKELSIASECWQANFSINAGEPVRVTNLTVLIEGEAKDEPIFQKLLAHLPIKEGDILNHARYEKIKSDLNSLALEHGYLKHKLTTKTLQVDPTTYSATIVLIMDSGARHHFGEITIDQDILDPDFLKRFVQIKPNEPYSSKKLAKTYNALAESIYFRSVEVSPEMDEIEDLHVPVNITLEPEKKHDYTLGIGYDTDIGPLASAGYRNRRINRNGHNFSFDLDVSPVLSSAEARYLIPFTEPRTDNVSIGFGYKYEQPDTFKAESAKLSLQYQHVYEVGWKQILFLDLSREDFTISDVSRTTNLLVPGGRWQFTRSDNPLRPTAGYHLNLSLSGAAHPIVSDVSFVQATLAGKFIAPLPWSARFISRANLGATLTSDFDRLPASYRFYAGGTETLRGYEYKKVGPTDAKGNVIGGKLLSVGSIEYEQFISDTWGVAAFLDAGNAFNPDAITIKYGTGLGVRWVSPIGPIRLDFAVPLSDSDSSFQIHFAAGAQL